MLFEGQIKEGKKGFRCNNVAGFQLLFKYVALLLNDSTGHPGYHNTIICSPGDNIWPSGYPTGSNSFYVTTNPNTETY